MIRRLCIVLALASCTHAPSPPAPIPTPRKPPAAIVVPHTDSTGLRASYDAADARLQAYRSLTPCAPSGPILCFDAGKETAAVQAGHKAKAALGGSKARKRVAAFHQAARRLPMP